jgi:predicted dehydrogenase
VSAVRARDYRTPNQPAESKTPWGAWIVVEYADGSSAMIRGVGCSQTRRPEKPFWIHGSDGTIRGRVLGSGHMPGSESVELERDGRTVGFQLDGRWNPDGFAGAMGELLTAIAEDREPFNSARHNLLSLRMTLAACRSADEGGRPVRLDEVPD